jgi:redox-sensitive bicupin YhaK (pirin superfamily)
MYHGEVVPGFPQHPHRGFETITLARDGYIDHSDSLGSTARFGHGDVQWMTAGKGIVHSEMFPLVNRDAENHCELFQIWLNLPASDKMVEPHFTMLWSETIPRHELLDEAGRKTEITVVAGRFGDASGPPTPPKSWAARPDSDVAVWPIRMQAGAEFTLPAAQPGTSRVLYFFVGGSVTIAGRTFREHASVQVRGDADLLVRAGDDDTELLMLQGKPIGEQVARYGPFVMNDVQGIEQAIMDYRRTQYGGWPWPKDDPVHPRERGRFAKHADGRVEDKE